MVFKRHQRDLAVGAGDYYFVVFVQGETYLAVHGKDYFRLAGIDCHGNSLGTVYDYGAVIETVRADRRDHEDIQRRIHDGAAGGQ